MAQTVIVQLTDDLDGSEADETVRFGFRNVAYEVDLNAKHASDLEKAISKYLDAARKIGRTPRATTKRSSSAKSDAGSIREWAKANGFVVSDRGRVSAEIREAYEAAH